MFHSLYRPLHKLEENTYDLVRTPSFFLNSGSLDTLFFSSSALIPATQQRIMGQIFYFLSKILSRCHHTFNEKTSSITRGCFSPNIHLSPAFISQIQLFQQHAFSKKKISRTFNLKRKGKTGPQLFLRTPPPDQKNCSTHPFVSSRIRRNVKFSEMVVAFGL